MYAWVFSDVSIFGTKLYILRAADKFWLFLFPIFLFATQLKEFFLDELKKLGQRSHKCVELRGEYEQKMHPFNPVACCFLYKATDLSAPPSYISPLVPSFQLHI
jgi:hypothetical protein